MRRPLHRTYLFTAIIVLTGALLFAAASGQVSAQESFYTYFFPSIITNHWTLSFIDSPRYFSDLGARAVGYQSADNPCLVYGNDHLYYACLSGGRWPMQEVDENIGVGRYATLAYSPAGLAGIAYFDEGKGALRFAYKTGSGWMNEVVDAPGDVGMYNSVGIGADNRVRIAYLDSTNGDLKFAIRLALSP
jgi:hypothetical protein